MDHLGIEKAHIVAGSMGGMIAQEMALQQPQRISKLVLFCTTAGGQPWQDTLLDMIKASDPGWDRSKSDLAGTKLQKFMVQMASRSFDGKLYQMLIMPLIKLQAALGKVKVPVGQLEAMISHNTLERLDKIQATHTGAGGGQGQSHAAAFIRGAGFPHQGRQTGGRRGRRACPGSRTLEQRSAGFPGKRLRLMPG